jgi:hypothetical protein
LASFNKELWQTVVYLFLSKFVQKAKTPFAQAALINEKNIDLASRFAQMVGDTTEETKVKFALLKGLRQLENDGLVERLSEESLQLSDEGFSKMKLEVETAMMKIAQSFPESQVKEPPEAPVQ